jgi:hypothetical protein
MKKIKNVKNVFYMYGSNDSMMTDCCVYVNDNLNQQNTPKSLDYHAVREYSTFLFSLRQTFNGRDFRILFLRQLVGNNELM